MAYSVVKSGAATKAIRWNSLLTAIMQSGGRRHSGLSIENKEGHVAGCVVQLDSTINLCNSGIVLS